MTQSRLRDMAEQDGATKIGIDEDRVRESVALLAARTDREAGPDLTDSPVPAGLDVPVHVAWSRVMQDVTWLAKDRDGKAGATLIKIRGIDDVRNAVGPAVRRHGVVVMPTGISAEYSYVETSKSGGSGSYTSRMNYARVTVQWTVIGPRGDTLPVGESLGEAFDPGDKASTKAQSIAERVFYIAALCLPTNQPQADTEHGEQYQLATPPPPTAEDYYDRIMNPATTVIALRQMGSELDRLPELAQAEVRDIDGTTVKLMDLLIKVGTERKRQAQGQ